MTLVDLFCGAGGMSRGLQAAGWNPLIAIDHFSAAVQTYNKNNGDHALNAEIHEDIELPPSVLIAGGPPCQGFSSAGMRRTGDHRNTLVSVFAKIIARQRPKAFIFENVEGFLSADNGEFILDLLAPLIDCGFRIHLRKINAANYGVPQHRKRVIAIGGLGWNPQFPEPTHNAIGAPGANKVARDLPTCPSIHSAIQHLPAPSDMAPGAPTGHYALCLNEEELNRVTALKPGQTMRDLPEELWHPSFKRRAFRRVKDGTPTERRGGAPAGIRRLHPDEPSKAITSFARNEFVHPTENRFLTLRECAAIQTFADDFEFLGKVAEQALLIGNAVPPRLAEVIGKSLIDQIVTAEQTFDNGALLSFLPSVSEGLSPALARARNLVLSTFGDQSINLALKLPNITSAGKQLAIWE